MCSTYFETSLREIFSASSLPPDVTTGTLTRWTLTAANLGGGGRPLCAELERAVDFPIFPSMTNPVACLPSVGWAP